MRASEFPSFAEVFRGVANSVDAFYFRCVLIVLLAFASEGQQRCLGKQPGLFGELTDREENDLQGVHKVAQIFRLKK
jgi:hypothetical protein